MQASRLSQPTLSTRQREIEPLSSLLYYIGVPFPVEFAVLVETEDRGVPRGKTIDEVW